MQDKIINPREQIKNRSEKPRGRPRKPIEPQPTKHKVSYSRQGLKKNEPNIEDDNSFIDINDDQENIPTKKDKIIPKFNIIESSNITVHLPNEALPVEKKGRGRPKKSHITFEVIPPKISIPTPEKEEDFSDSTVEIKEENLIDCIEVNEGKKHVKITLTKQKNRAVRLQIFLNDVEIRSTSFLGSSSSKNYWSLLKGIIK